MSVVLLGTVFHCCSFFILQESTQYYHYNAVGKKTLCFLDTQTKVIPYTNNRLLYGFSNDSSASFKFKFFTWLQEM